jgi:hypothetical protein
VHAIAWRAGSALQEVVEVVEVGIELGGGTATARFAPEVKDPAFKRAGGQGRRMSRPQHLGHGRPASREPGMHRDTGWHLPAGSAPKTPLEHQDGS